MFLILNERKHQFCIIIFTINKLQVSNQNKDYGDLDSNYLIRILLTESIDLMSFDINN